MIDKSIHLSHSSPQLLQNSITIITSTFLSHPPFHLNSHTIDLPKLFQPFSCLFAFAKTLIQPIHSTNKHNNNSNNNRTALHPTSMYYPDQVLADWNKVARSSITNPLKLHLSESIHPFPGPFPGAVLVHEAGGVGDVDVCCECFHDCKISGLGSAWVQS